MQNCSLQDYNRQVLDALTIPNVQANLNRLPAGRHRGEVRYFAGSWQAFPAFLDASGLNKSYDVVLTAETVYDSTSSLQMYQCLLQVTFHRIVLDMVECLICYEAVISDSNPCVQLQDHVSF